MAKILSFQDQRFTKQITLKDSDDKFSCHIEVGVTTDDLGNPILHISCDEEEIFENPNTYEMSLLDFLEGIAQNYLEGHYSDGPNPVKSYKQLASVLRHHAILMDLKAEENESCNKHEVKGE